MNRLSYKKRQLHKLGMVLAASAIALISCNNAALAKAITGKAAKSSPRGNCGALALAGNASVVINLVQRVDGGTFTLPRAGGRAAPAQTFDRLPAFCRVAATLRPSPSSNIKAEVWLPDNWNGKFLGIGTGGLGGVIDYRTMIDGLRRGYAVANSDVGTASGVPDMVGDMDRISDFGHRAVHSMTTLAKTLIRRQYATAPSRSYFHGCSSGGAQGLAEAQRYPADYDGIIAGAPVPNRVAAHILYLWGYASVRKDPASYLPETKRQLWGRTVMAACDGLDGVKDGLIGAPGLCKADPGVIECTGDDGPGCLTSPQVAAMRNVYAGVRNSQTGATISPGFLPGTEDNFRWLGSSIDSPHDSMWPFQWVWGMDWDWRSFNFGTDAIAMQNALGWAVDSTQADLSAFKARGGKLIVYHGLADGIVSPRATMEYLDAVQAQTPGGSDTFVKAFLAPGMGHCRGGNGPHSFGNVASGTDTPGSDPHSNVLASLEQWVEKRREPADLIASQFANSTSGRQLVRTMPLCPWPKIARYKGTGSINEAASFTCAEPTKN